MMALQKYKIVVMRDFPLKKFPEGEDAATLTPGEYEIRFDRVGEVDWLVLANGSGWGAPTDFWARWHNRAWKQPGDSDVLPFEEL